jgi:hypothetical protein
VCVAGVCHHGDGGVGDRVGEYLFAVMEGVALFRAVTDSNFP